MANDVVLEGRVQEMLAVEVEVSPFDGSLRGPLQQLARRVAEELRDVDALDLALGGRRPARAAAGGRLSVPEEVGEEVVEQTAAAATEAARHLLFGDVDLAEILDFLRPVRAKPHPRRDCGPSVSGANGLI